jgi:transposase-like protein
VRGFFWTVQLLILQGRGRTIQWHRQSRSERSARGVRTEEFKQEAVQLLLDGHSAPSVAERLGPSRPNVLYSWKKAILHRAGPGGCKWLGGWGLQREGRASRARQVRKIRKIRSGLEANYRYGRGLG